MKHVFISYSHKDKDYATSLANSIEKRDLPVWIDNRIDYGSKWLEIIQEQLDNCSVFVVIMTTQAFKSVWVQNEVLRALDKQKKIIPLLLEGDVWLSLQAIHYVDVKGSNLPPEKFYETLKQNLEFISDKKSDVNWNKLTEQKSNLIREAKDLLNKQFGLLSEMVTQPLANEILVETIKPALYNWRSGKIKTIREIQPDVDNRLENWIRREGLENLLGPIFSIWFKGVCFEIDNIAAAFYQEYEVKAKFRLVFYSKDLGLFEKGISLEGEQFKAVFSKGLRNSLLAVYVVLIVIVSQWVETFFQAVSGRSFIGIFIYGAIMGLGEYFKSRAGSNEEDFNQHALLDINVPTLVRKMVLTEGKIQYQLNDTRASLREEINKIMNNELQSKFLNATNASIEQQMERQFEEIEMSLRKETNNI